MMSEKRDSIKKVERNESISLSIIDFFLLFLSITLWLFSQGLVAFITFEVWLGREVLVYSIFGGWLSGFIQGYTNISYLICVIRLLYGRNPYILSTVTFLVGLSSFFVDKIPHPSAVKVGHVTVQGWGWGAVLWLLSYLLIVLICIDKTHFKKKRLLVGLFLYPIPIICLIILALGRFQYEQANDEERERLFPLAGQTAFITTELSHIPYNPPKIELKATDLIEIKEGNRGEYTIATLEICNVRVSLPAKYIYKGNIYHRFDHHLYGEWIFEQKFTSKQQPNISLSILDGKARDVRLYHREKQQMLWSAPVIIETNKKGYKSEYPRYSYQKMYKAIAARDFNFTLQDDFNFSRISFEKKKSAFKECTLYKTSLPSKTAINIYQCDNWEGDVAALYYDEEKKVFLVLLQIVNQSAGETQGCVIFFDRLHQRFSNRYSSFTANFTSICDWQKITVHCIEDETNPKRVKLNLHNHETDTDIIVPLL